MVGWLDVWLVGWFVCSFVHSLFAGWSVNSALSQSVSYLGDVRMDRNLSRCVTQFSQ